MNEYVDVRGPWPIYVHGVAARILPFASRLITVAQARDYVPPTPQPED